MEAQILAKLSDFDKRALLSIYEHRCLNEDMLYKYVYLEKDVHRSYTTRRVNRLEELNLIEQIDYNNEFPALFLTNTGIRVVRMAYPREIAALTKTEGKLLTASDLRIGSVNINHQMHLNQFALETCSMMQGVPHKYFDEKYMPVASQYMMADGMIELENRVLFLETDMGTERSGRLAQKWESYRSFLKDKGAYYQNKRIEVYFILEGLKNPIQRILTVSKSVLSYLADYIGKDFEIYINTPDFLRQVILNSMQKSEISCARNLRETGFLVSHSNFLDEINLPNAIYIRKINEQRKIQIVEGKAQEYIVEEWSDTRMSVLNTLLSFQKKQARIKEYAKRKISYIIVVPSEKEIVRILKALDMIQPDDLLFTTQNRLEGNEWAAALFRFDQLGNLYHFKDAGLKELIHERRYVN